MDLFTKTKIAQVLDGSRLQLNGAGHNRDGAATPFVRGAFRQWFED
jgi:hypothetical protein